MFEKLSGGQLGTSAIGGIVMDFVTQHANKFSGQSLVKKLENRLPIGRVILSHRTLHHMFAGLFAAHFQITYKRCISGHGYLLKAVHTICCRAIVIPLAAGFLSCQRHHAWPLWLRPSLSERRTLPCLPG